MSTDLIRRDPTAIIPATFEEAQSLGAVLAQSKYFTDAQGAAQAVVKVLAGAELGLPPIASMSGIHVISGKPSLSANLMAGCIKRSGRYDYRVIELTARRCEIAFFEVGPKGREEIGRTDFTYEEAKVAGTKNLDKFPRNMLFARALSNGVRFFCPDVFYGPVYTPDELGREVNEDGQVIDAEPVVVTSSGPVIAATGEVLEAQAVTEPERTHELGLTPMQLKNAAFNRLVESDGWWPATDDIPANKAAFCNLLGRTIDKLKDLTAEDIDQAREELEARNKHRRRFFALGGIQEQDSGRQQLAQILGITVESRRWLTSEQWQQAADKLEAARAVDDDPFDD